MASPGVSQAQSVDGLISSENIGFDPPPASGTIDDQVEIDNNGFGPNRAPATPMSFNIRAGATISGTRGDLRNCAPTTGAGPLTMTGNRPALDLFEHVTQIFRGTAAADGTLTVDVLIPVGTQPETTRNDDDESTTISAGADIGFDHTRAATTAAGG